jgi:hypothetical protein
MAKINIPNISSPYASQNALNVRFKMIEDVLNDKVLWRDNPIGEVNTLKNDIDMGNNDLLNVGLVSASSIMVQGQGLNEGITEAVARCIEEADKAEASANAAAANADSAEASAIRAEEAAEQAELPVVSPGDEGKVLTVSPSLEKEWAEVPEELPPYSVADEGKILKVSSLGETEWGIEEKELPSYTLLDAGKTLSVNETGNAVEWTEPPKGSVNIAPQTIVRAQVGPRPDGWTAADCDAPVQSMSAESAVIVNNDVLPVFSSSNSSGGMTVSAQSIYSSTYPVWKAFNKQAVNYTDSWQSGNDFASDTGVGSSWIQVDMGSQFNVARIVLYPRNEDGTFNTNFPYDFDIVIDGVKVKEVRNAIPPSSTARMEFDLDSPVTGQIVRLDITRTGGASVTSLGQFYVYDAEVVSGSALVQIAAGLQVAYADEGRVQLSDVLDSAHAVDLSAAADGTSYIYADLSEDGAFSGFGATAVAPEVGAEKADTLADHFNPAEVVMYNVAGSPVRRVYIGTAEKASGAITSVHCYSLGTVVTMPINSGNPVATQSLVLDELPYAYSRMMQVEPQLYGEGIWGKAGWIYTSAGLGVSATVRKEAIRVVTGTGLTAQYASIGGDFNANIPSPAKIRVTVHRGY